MKLVELFKLSGPVLSLVCCLVIRGSTGGFLLLRDFSGDVSSRGLLSDTIRQYVVSVESSPLTHHRLYS